MGCEQCPERAKRTQDFYDAVARETRFTPTASWRREIDAIADYADADFTRNCQGLVIGDVPFKGIIGLLGRTRVGYICNSPSLEQEAASLTVVS